MVYQSVVYLIAMIDAATRDYNNLEKFGSTSVADYTSHFVNCISINNLIILVLKLV